ncbi:hypothetical protein AAMO2058_001592500 [Amorphochlora amoebiformis]
MPGGKRHARQRREKRKAAQSGCIKSPPLKKIKEYNARIRYHEQDHVKSQSGCTRPWVHPTASTYCTQGVLPGRGVPRGGLGYTEEADARAGQISLLDNGFAAAFAEDSELNILGRDLKITFNDNPYAPTSININGRQGSQFFREISKKFAAGMLNGCREVKELLILVNLQVCITIRDIIGRVMVENDWKPSDVAKISETRRRCMNLVLAVFGKERMQPYVLAIFIELTYTAKATPITETNNSSGHHNPQRSKF